MVQLACVRCGAGLEVQVEQTGFTCPACSTVTDCYACPHCARARCLPATTLDKDVSCRWCATRSPLGSWASRLVSLTQVSDELHAADHYRRAVTGIVATSSGIPMVTSGALSIVIFGPDQLDVVMPDTYGDRSVETLALNEVDEVTVTSTGPITETLYCDVAIAAGPRRLVLRSKTFGPSTLDQLLAPVRIRIDTARRAPQPVTVALPATAPSVPLNPQPPAPTSIQIASPPPELAPARGRDPRKWALVGAAIALVAAVILLAAALIGNRPAADTSPSTAAGSTSIPADESSDDGSLDPGSGHRPASGRTPSTPALIPGPDGSAQTESCPSGNVIMAATGWPARAGRGTTMTSCQFARNVGEAYWRAGTPSQAQRRVVAPGAVPCSLGGSLCENHLFVMSCRVVAGQDWVTCEGGRNAVVYLYGQ